MASRAETKEWEEQKWLLPLPSLAYKALIPTIQQPIKKAPDQWRHLQFHVLRQH